jgi:hypothetical protein
MAKRGAATATALVAATLLAVAPAAGQTPAATPGGAAQPATPAPAAAPPDPAARLQIPTPINQIPPTASVQLVGMVKSAQPGNFVLDDGSAAVVVEAGPDWDRKTSVRVGDRIRVIGRMDAYGSGRFVAGMLIRADGRSFPLQPFN